MSNDDQEMTRVKDLSIPLDQDVFMRSLIRELTNVLEGVVGIEQAKGFISVVGQTIGRQIDEYYRLAYGVDVLNPDQVAAALVDLKRRIKGDFYLIEQTEDRIVLGNRVCPFAEKVLGQKAMCMMTSNVFGCIAAENLGYAKVALKETIAEGAPECRVVVYLKAGTEADAAEGREYYKTTSDAT